MLCASSATAAVSSTASQADVPIPCFSTLTVHIHISSQCPFHSFSGEVFPPSSQAVMSGSAVYSMSGWKVASSCQFGKPTPLQHCSWDSRTADHLTHTSHACLPGSQLQRASCFHILQHSGRVHNRQEAQLQCWCSCGISTRTPAVRGQNSPAFYLPRASHVHP